MAESRAHHDPQPSAQDERTHGALDEDEPVVPPAPANQPTPHDGGLEPAPPPRNAAARALRRFGRLLRGDRSPLQG